MQSVAGTLLERDEVLEIVSKFWGLRKLTKSLIMALRKQCWPGGSGSDNGVGAENSLTELELKTP